MNSEVGVKTEAENWRKNETASSMFGMSSSGSQKFVYVVSSVELLNWEKFSIQVCYFYS